MRPKPSKPGFLKDSSHRKFKSRPRCPETSESRRGADGCPDRGEAGRGVNQTPLHPIPPRDVVTPSPEYYTQSRDRIAQSRNHALRARAPLRRRTDQDTRRAAHGWRRCAEDRTAAEPRRGAERARRCPKAGRTQRRTPQRQREPRRRAEAQRRRDAPRTAEADADAPTHPRTHAREERRRTHEEGRRGGKDARTLFTAIDNRPARTALETALNRATEGDALRGGLLSLARCTAARRPESPHFDTLKNFFANRAKKC